MANSMTIPTVAAHLYRDRDPEARALGGWSVEIDVPTTTGYARPTTTTDYYRDPCSALAAALVLAYELGVCLEVSR